MIDVRRPVSTWFLNLTVSVVFVYNYIYIFFFGNKSVQQISKHHQKEIHLYF